MINTILFQYYAFKNDRFNFQIIEIIIFVVDLNLTSSQNLTNSILIFVFLHFNHINFILNIASMYHSHNVKLIRKSF